MITHKLKIKNRINVMVYSESYSHLFRKLYSNFELSEDKNFEKEMREKYNIDSWIFQSCKTELKTKLAQEETSKKKKITLLNSLEKELAGGIESKRHKYWVFKKIAQLKSSLNDKIIFGGNAILRKISFLSNDKIKNEKEIAAWTKKYNQNRLLPISIIGEAPQKSNRKFDFDFENNKMIFKPKFGIKIPIEFHCGKNQHKQLMQLQQMIGIMPISVRLNNDYVWITFNEEKLSGFSFNEIEYFKELKTIPKENKLERKECGKKWVQEKESRMLFGKNPNRFISFVPSQTRRCFMPRPR